MKIKTIVGCLIFFFLSELALSAELPEDKYWLLEIEEGMNLDSIFSDSLWVIGRINRISQIYLDSVETVKVPYDFEWAKTWSPLPKTLESFRDSAKLIYINLSDQWLGTYEKGIQINSFPICSGRKGIDEKGRKSYETPIGNFKIEKKYRKGWSKVFKVWVYWQMLFYEKFIIHGSKYLPGYPISHGCVRLFLQDAEWLYKWASVNTPVIIRK